MARITHQKQVLHEEVQKLKSFFTADVLHEKAQNHRIGLATVYRFLKDAEKSGDIHSFMCDSRKIYSIDKRTHVHFSCEKCGARKHIRIENADFLKKITADEVCHFQIELVGICSE